MAANLAVLLSLSNLGETSDISKLIVFCDFKICFIIVKTFSGSIPNGCGELTPGAKAEENTSEQIVIYI